LVENISPLLCYKEPFNENINKTKHTQTIGWQQALQIIINNGAIIPDSDKEIFKRLSYIRNDIIHYKFEYNNAEMQQIFVNCLTSLRSIVKITSNIDIYDDVNADSKKFLKEIEDEYKQKIHFAQARALEESNGVRVYKCYVCGTEKTTVKNGQHYSCKFCTIEYFKCSICNKYMPLTCEIKLDAKTNGENESMCTKCYEKIKDEY
jgi:hypothetical protein